MTTTLEQQAREAAEAFADSVDAETGGTICKGSYMNGFLAAAEPREKEIAELQEMYEQEKVNYQSALGAYNSAQEAYNMLRTRLEKEIAELRAKLVNKDGYIRELENEEW